MTLTLPLENLKLQSLYYAYAYFFVRFFATLALLSSTEPNGPGNTELVFIMIFQVFECLTFGVQHILAMKSLRRSGRKITNFDKFGLTYNAAIHLAEWALTGLDHEWAPGTTQ